MQNISILSAVMTLMSNQVWAQVLTEDEEAEFAVYWNDVMGDYNIGEEFGDNEFICTRRAVRTYWYNAFIACLTLDESRHEKCQNNQLTKLNDTLETCVIETLPTSCEDFTELELSNMTIYSTKRIIQHNERRALHYFTPDLEFSLDLACQAYQHALSAQAIGSLDYATDLLLASPP